MKTWTVHYQVKTAPRTFYPRQIEVQAKTKREASGAALKIINENTDFEKVEKIIIGEIVLS